MTVIGSKGVSEGDISAAVGAVDSVFGRSGVVAAVTADYTTAMVAVVSAYRPITSAEYTRMLQVEVSAEKNYARVSAGELTGSASNNLRSFSVVDIRVIASTYAVTVSGGNVSSVFGRTGAIVAVSADYNANQIANGPNKVIMTTAQSDKLATIQASAQVNPSAAESSDLSGSTPLIWSADQIKAIVTAYANTSALVQSYAASPFTTVARITQAGEVTYRRNAGSLPNNTIVFTTEEELSAFKMMSVIASSYTTAGIVMPIPVSVVATARSFLMNTGWKPSSCGFDIPKSNGFEGSGNAQSAFAKMISFASVEFDNSNIWSLTSTGSAQHFGALVCQYLGASGDDYEIQMLRDDVKGYYLSHTGGGTYFESTVLDHYAINANDVIPFISGISTNAGTRQTAHAKISGNNILEMSSPPTEAIGAVNALIYPVEFRGSAFAVYHVSARCSGSGTGAGRILPIMTAVGGAGSTVDAIDWSHAVIFLQYQNPSSVNENLGTQFDRPKSYPLIIPNNGSTVSMRFSTAAQCSGGQAYAYILACTAMNVFHHVVTGAPARVEVNLATSALSSVREAMVISQAITTCTSWPAGVYSSILKSSSTAVFYNSMGLNDSEGKLYITIATMPRDN